MTTKFYRFIEKLYDKKIDASGLAYFRIFYSLVLLCEVVQLYYFRHLVFDKIPFLELSEVNFSYALVAWMITLLLLTAGLFTRQVAIINYLFSLVFIAAINTYEYHMFYVYMGVNFLFMFTSISQVNSLDRLLLKFKYSNTRFNFVPPTTVSVLNYYVFVLVAIAFVYFDSVFFKFVSHNWLHGLGMWLPASLPHITHVDTSFILNLKWLSLGLGYLTLAFETVFIFTFFRKKWRVILLLIGIGLHIGIVIQFPIPWFGLGVTALYLLLVPVNWWRRLKNFLAFKKPYLTIYYDEECPLCNRTKIFLTHVDSFKALEFKGVQTYANSQPLLEGVSRDELLDNIYSVTNDNKVLKGVDTYKAAFKKTPGFFLLGLLISIPGIYHVAKAVYNLVAKNRYVERCTEDNCGYTPPSLPLNRDAIKITHKHTIKDLHVLFISVGLALLILMQLNVTYNARLINLVKVKIGFANSYLDKVTQKISLPLRKKTKIFFGITSHGVFMDQHFNGYNHIIAVEAELENGRKVWLPIIDQQGHAGFYAYSFAFVKWTFRVNSSQLNRLNIENGVRDFTAFWAYQNSVNLSNVKFNVYVKEIEIPVKWEYNFLGNQEAKPWRRIGDAFWEGGEFKVNLVLPEVDL